MLDRAQLTESVGALLGWDEQVNLPPGAAEQRARQGALLAELHHAAVADSRIGELLKELEKASGLGLVDEFRAGEAKSSRDPGSAPPATVDRAAVIRQARRDYDRATRLPAAFVGEKAAHSSRSYHAWAAAKAASDFPSYAPFIAKHLELARREAAYLGFEARPYDYFIDQNDPGMTAEVIGRLFRELAAGLVPFVRAVLDSRIKPPVRPLRGCPIDAQKKFGRLITAQIGFDYRHGRLDESLHPFCSGNGTDTRMTTKFNVDDPLDAIFSSLHETGHGLYEQGLPAGAYGTALGIHAGMGVHESQSRLWENQVGRGRPFWTFFEPRFRDAFPAQTTGLSSDALYLAINAVEPSLIRVEADEVTYNLHVILRFELEKKLFTGELAVEGLPEAWRKLAKELLGLEPANDREGVLQDVHWSGGSFGYFPSYCLGNMMAAQLWYRALEVLPGLEEDFARGDFSRLLGWLRKEVHSQGRRYGLLELVKRATGQEFSPKPLLRYLKERYGPLYL